MILFEHYDTAIVERVREASHGGATPVIAVALRPGSLGEAAGWELVASGAADVLGPGDPAEIARAAAARFERWDAVDRLLVSPLVRRNLVGDGAAWRSVLRRVVEAARFSASPMLVGGESGTGKELVARLIHTLDPREDKGDLVILDCSTVVPELSGSEFFGHQRGAYTGAAASREGAFALADGGTLFLDEIGELPPRLQAELLRVVQEGTYKPVGGDTWHETRFRLVCATHRDLPRAVEEGRFRRDLYFRLAVWTCTLPPLGHRREDVPALAVHFLAEHFGDDPPALDPAVLHLLLARDYPGNVRELRHMVARIALRHVGDGPVTLGDVPEEERPRPDVPLPGPAAAADLFERAARVALLGGVGLKEIANLATDSAARVALAREDGNVRRAAELLGVTDRALQMRRAAWRKSDGNGSG